MKHSYFILALSTFMSLISAKTLAYDCQVNGIYYNINSSTNEATVTYKQSTKVYNNTTYTSDYAGSVIIPSSFVYNNISYKVISIDAHAFSNCIQLTSITIPYSIKRIKTYAFEGCTNLKKAIVPDIEAWCNIDFGTIGPSNAGTESSYNPLLKYARRLYSDNDTEITSLVIPQTVSSISDLAFSECTSLKSVTLPNSITSIGDGAFYGCTNLNSITIPSSVKAIGYYAFLHSGLEKVIIQDIAAWCSIDFAGANPLSVAHHLYSDDIHEIKNLQIPNSVTAIGSYAFCGCTFLESITIPNNVSFIGKSAFSGCSGLNTLTIGNGVQSIDENAFSGCTGLTTLIIPNSVTSINKSAFSGCAGLTSISIPNSVNYIGEYAFYNCKGLLKVSIASDISGIERTAFNNCPIENVNLDMESVKNVNDIFGSQVKEYILGDSVSVVEDKAFINCTDMREIVFGKGIRKVGYQPFLKCDSLKQVVIEDITSWCSIDFANFDSNPIYKTQKLFTYELIGLINPSNKTTVNFKKLIEVKDLVIPDSVMTVSNYAFVNCIGITSLILPSSLISIGMSAFQDCQGLTSVSIPENVENIGLHAFSGCNQLTVVTLNCNLFLSHDRTSSWDSKQKKYVYSSMKDVFGEQVVSYTLGNEVTQLGKYAFADCVNMKSLAIPSSLSSIDENAFSGCTGLDKVIAPDIAAWCNITYDKYSGQYNQSNPLFYAQHLYSDENTEITELKIPEGVTSIGNIAFIKCGSITSVSFPSTLKTIRDMAFIYCDGLTFVDIPEGVTEINAAFWGCTNLTNVKLPTSLTNISSSAFNDCKSLRSINIPNNVTSIGSNAFAGCESLKELTFPDNIISVGGNAFSDSLKLYVDRKSATLLAMWQAGYKPYLMGTEDILEPPYLSVVATSQTTATFKIENIYDGFNYSYGYTWNAIPITGDEVTITNLFPETNTYFRVGVSLDDSGDNLCTLLCDYSTQPIAPTIDIKATASSVHATATYIGGDAEVTSQRLVLNPSSVSSSKIRGGTDIDGTTYTITGLDPQTSNTSFAYEIIVSNGNETKAYRTQKIVATTENLKLTTQQPKVVSVGNVIVAAESNLDDEEINVGFEWRRTDWNDDFASNKGGAYLYEGFMEGYIRNLYTEKLWKYRPYYTSDSGKTYYGEWVGIDPTNTSYFEPTVHTYASITVNGNQASIKGYAMRGTDNITQQGFKYWKANDASNAVARHAANIPTDAMTVEANGSIMTASLTGLDYEAKYCYVAFAKTSEGETFYGEMMTFRTEEAPSGIEMVRYSGDVYEVARYDMQGHKLREPQPGLNIIRMSNGSTKKVMVK